MFQVKLRKLRCVVKTGNESGKVGCNLQGVRFASWVHRLLLEGCEYDENLIIITDFSFFMGAPAPPMVYIDLPLPVKDIGALL